jgi:hypothetical protein
MGNNEMSGLCEFEDDVIRLCAGLPQDSITGWGAGLGAALGPLHRGGYLKREIIADKITYSATEKGLAAIGGKNESA